MIIIAIANQKGGVAKTTTATNVAAALAENGHLTLLIDLDPQANATQTHQLPPHHNTTYDILNETATIDQTTQTINPNLHIIPSHPKLAKLEPTLTGPTTYYRLETAIHQTTHPYQYVILDCPPSLGNITLNALLAADHLIIPITPGTYAMQGLHDLLTNTKAIQHRINPKLTILGIVITRAEPRKTLHKEIIQYLTTQYGPTIFTTHIRNNISIDEAANNKQNIYQYAPNSTGAQDYRNLTNEILHRTQHPGETTP
jgi:chromosome partitioning protein